MAASRTLVGRLGDPRDIADGVLYLASDESAFVTGTVLQVNGGSLLMQAIRPATDRSGQPLS